MSQQDKELLLREWFEKLEKPLMIYAFQIVHDRDEAQDLVQDAFLRFSRQEKEIHEPKAWLYKTTRNLSIDTLRKRAKRVHQTKEQQLDFLSEVESESKDDPVQELEKQEKVRRVRHSLNLLPKESQKLITMKFDQKMSYKQIADETGLSVSNVGYKLHVIIRDLSTELQEEGIIG